jgi:hypothetical protein
MTGKDEISDKLRITADPGSLPSLIHQAGKILTGPDSEFHVLNFYFFLQT